MEAESETAKFDLTLTMTEGPSGLEASFEYATGLFDEATIGRLSEHLHLLLGGIVAYPESCISELRLLSAPERHQLLRDWNATVHEYPEPRDLIGRFEGQVEKTPEAIAVACGEARLTYRELNARANRVAHGLSQLGVGPDSLAALLDDRSVDFLVMMLGIFKVGGAYVPLDPAHPDGRMMQVLEESRVRFILCGETYRARAEGLIEAAAISLPTLVSLAELEAHEGVFPNPPRRHTEQNLAFVIYTSGSTGKPKGAMVEHRGMFNNLITKVPALGLTERDVIAQTASQCFDISVWQYLTALTCGAWVEVFPDEISRDPARLLEQLAARGVTILETVPSMIRALLEIAEAGLELPALRWLIPCGEAFPPELCRQWMQRFSDLKLLNAYGPAECSDDVSYHPIEKPKDDDLTVPIGRPVHNTRLYVLNRWLEPVPVGVPGEICVGGIQVGRGYLNRADLTAAAFIPDPFGETGGRLYRTGDLGRYRADGVLEFLGRIDHQVKIRGHRIEPGEIEACLLTSPEVREACVVPREISEGVYRLVAYVVGAVREMGELRAHILKTLPEYMVPAAFVFLEALPLTSSGKVDRKRLPDPDIEAQLAHQYAAPRNPTEEILANIWAEILGVERVGIHDNFFALGGHSLLAVTLIERMRRQELALDVRALFTTPTVAGLAAAVGGERVVNVPPNSVR